MVWYNDLYEVAVSTYDIASDYAGYAYDYVSDLYEDSYLESAYENVSGFLGIGDAPPQTYSTSYAAKINAPIKPSFEFDAAALQSTRENVLARTMSGVAAYSDYAPEPASWLDSAWGSVKRGVNTAQDWYGEFSESAVGQFVDEVVGYGAGKGAPNFKGIPVQRVSAPGVGSAGNFRSTAVDLTAGFADPRISNAMQKALSSDVPQIQLVLQSIQPTRTGARATISAGSSSVSAPKIRKIKSKLASAD